MTKPIAWSPSRLSAFELCPRKYHKTYIEKAYPFEESEAQTWGNDVHRAIHTRIKTKADLPLGMGQFLEKVDPFLKFGGVVATEMKLAINKQLEPVDYFASDVWCRVIVDVAAISGTEAMIGDWKTGQVKEDYLQLDAMALVLFSHQPALQVIVAAYVWLKERSLSPVKGYSRDHLGNLLRELLPRINAYEAAHHSSAAVAVEFPPKPSGICRRWCPVTECEYYGG
jgi:hypothetical protein